MSTTVSMTRPNKPNKRAVARTAMIVVLASETAFFGTLLMSYLYLRTGQTSWPFIHPELPRLIVPGVNTLILLASMAVAWIGQRSAEREAIAPLKRALAITSILGLIFMCGQIFEFTRTGMRPDGPAFGGVFFALMGFHGLHVMAGEVFNGLNLFRARRGDFDAGLQASIEAGVWFWTYITGVWVMLAAALYVI